jgi:hypothetical protein
MTYSNPKTSNYIVSMNDMQLQAPMDSHTDFPYHADFPKVVDALPMLKKSRTPAFLNLICNEINRARTEALKPMEHKK